MEGLLRFAHKYDFARTTFLCQNFMQSYLESNRAPKTILYWLELGDSLNLDPLVDSCLKTIKKSMTVRCPGSFGYSKSGTCRRHLESDVMCSMKELVTSGGLSSDLLGKLCVWLLDLDHPPMFPSNPMTNWS